MTDPLTEPTLAALDDLLEAEKAALLIGDLDGAVRLAAQKESLVAALSDLSAGARPALEAVQTKARRNEALLEGALEGIRAVADRLRILRETRRTLETYDSKGRRQSIGNTARPSVERRA